MSDSRNFRSQYYEKVGFRGVEGKKSLQILLKDDPVDLEKLAVFCVRFPVPVVYRPLVWKLLLGILPPHHTTHEYVRQQRQEQFDDVYHSLRVMSVVSTNTPLNIVFMKTFLLEEGALPLEDETVVYSQIFTDSVSPMRVVGEEYFACLPVAENVTYTAKATYGQTTFSLS